MAARQWVPSEIPYYALHAHTVCIIQHTLV